MLCQQILHTIGTQANTSGTGKDDGIIAGLNFTQPGAQDASRGLGQRRRPFPAALANDTHMGSRGQTNVTATQASDLRQAQSRLNGQQHERVVTPSRATARVRSAQKGIDFISREKPDLGAGEALVRDGQHPLNLRRVSRHLERGIPKEGADGRQPQVSAASADAAAGLHFLKEGRDQRCIDLLEGQLLRRHAELFLRELQKQSKAVPVRGDGVGTGLALLHQPTRKKALQE